MLGRRLRVMVGAGKPPEPIQRTTSTADGAGVARLGTLEWRACGSWLAPYWELWAEGERLATFRLVGTLRRSGVAETATTRWRLRRQGWLSLHEIVGEGEDAPALRFRPGLFHGGRIERQAGPMLRFKPSFFRREARVMDEGGFVMLTVRRRRGLFHIQGEAAFEDAGRRLPDAEPLLMMAWWLLLGVRHHHGE